jgi:hypothetical protein
MTEWPHIQVHNPWPHVSIQKVIQKIRMPSKLNGQQLEYPL